MVIGTIENLEKEQKEHPAAIREALEYLRSQDFTKLPDGKYPIGDQGITANLQRYHTKDIDDCRPEAHKKYIDIQYLVEGEEYLGWCPLSPDLAADQEYDSEKDIIFYRKLVPDSNVILFPGSFAVLYPVDVHRPCGSIDDEPAAVTKVVVKIPVELV